ncbi:hypothetical protein ACIA8C_18350 [Nocardia sp. NPDC051321]|uniref:hypothetical protein n=1 Tax=Nocardia sp. NPDC051321 TaxID=3364323 RepID=UPI00378B1B92
MSAATIVIDPDVGISASKGAIFATVTTPGYSACAAANYNLTSRAWTELPTGTTLCIRTEDTRVGRVQFFWKKGRDTTAAAIRVIGVIWEPKHP